MNGFRRRTGVDRGRAHSRLGFVGWIAVAAFAVPLDALAAEQYFDHGGDGFTSSYTVSTSGTRTADGGCSWATPVLELERFQVVIEARQISADWDTCGAVYEVGTPADASDGAETSDGTDTEEAAVDETPPPPPPSCPPWDPRACTSSVEPTSEVADEAGSGRYIVWWEDIIHIDLTKTRSHIAWSWDGNCVKASSGKGSYWWRSGTGWKKLSSNAKILKGCSLSKVYVDAKYLNDLQAFCGNDIYNGYTDVTVRGHYNGRLSGYVENTWATHCNNGPDIHWHARLKRDV